MDNKRELNDILMGGDDIRAKSNKKMIALVLGIVVLILAIVIIVVAMTGDKSKSTTAENTATTTDVNPQQGNFANMNVDNNDEDKFEQIVKDMKSDTDNTNSTISSNNVNDTNTIHPVNQSIPTIRQDSPKITMPSRKVRTTTASKTIVFNNNDSLKNGAMAESGYYLQVGAFSKTPNKDFIKKLNKFSYRKQEIMINSNVITRYLIGPYSSREAAQKDFDRVNTEIARPVFLQIQ